MRRIVKLRRWMESVINCKGGNKDKRRRSKDGFMNAGRGGGGRRVLLVGDLGIHNQD